MKQFKLAAGSVVHVHGFPFYLVQDTEIWGSSIEDQKVLPDNGFHCTGWKFVPTEPTPEMKQAGGEYRDACKASGVPRTVGGYYRSMVSAAPQKAVAGQWRACFGEKGMRTYITNGERTIYSSKDDADFLRDALNASGMLDKKAQIGATVFGVGVSWEAVVLRAQREYEHNNMTK